ncbi:MAG: PEP-CTERM sorting domain-containing protein [Acidobacteria bacterium]|nr:PEP-CTERM sorting domain-containing protein [Acidobacteriota bacterium]
MNANGTWSLYVLDDLGGDSGSITNGWTLDIYTDGQAQVPEPSTYALCGLGLAGVAYLRRRRK